MVLTPQQKLPFMQCAASDRLGSFPASRCGCEHYLVHFYTSTAAMRAVSTGRRNTLIYGRRWRDQNEVLSPRIFTEKKKSEIWDRWQRGESMSLIGRVFDWGASSIFPLLERTGGIRPPNRVRSRLAL